MRASMLPPIQTLQLSKAAQSGPARPSGGQQSGRESQSAASGNGVQDQAQMKALQGMAHHVTENSRQMNELASDIEQIKGLLNAILTEVRQLKGGASSSTVKAMQDKMAQAARSNSQRF